MSRTYRRKNLYNSNDIPSWVFRERWCSMAEYESILEKHEDSIEYVTNSSYGWGYRVDVWFGRKSKEGKRRLAVYMSDADTNPRHRPHKWFVTCRTQRPYRREANNELRKYMLDTEYEYMIESMPQLGWWD